MVGAFVFFSSLLQFMRFLLNFVKQFAHQLEVSKKLALMSSFPQKSTYYFQCYKIAVLYAFSLDIYIDIFLASKNANNETGVIVMF